MFYFMLNWRINTSFSYYSSALCVHLTEAEGIRVLCRKTIIILWNISPVHSLQGGDFLRMLFHYWIWTKHMIYKTRSSEAAACWVAHECNVHANKVTAYCVAATKCVTGKRVWRLHCTMQCGSHTHSSLLLSSALCKAKTVIIKQKLDQRQLAYSVGLQLLILF